MVLFLPNFSHRRTEYYFPQLSILLTQVDFLPTAKTNTGIFQRLFTKLKLFLNTKLFKTKKPRHFMLYREICPKRLSQ